MSPYLLPSIPALSSLEIAEKTGKRHDHVIRDIESTLEAAGIGAPRFGGTYLDSQNKERPCYYLPRRECLLVVSGYSPKLRLAILDRLEELEQKPAAPQLPASYAAALRELADSTEQLEVANLKLADAAPKVEFHDTVTASADVVVMAVAVQTAKLPFGSVTAFRKLREMGVLISGGQRHNLPKQRYIEQGLFVVNEFKYEHSSGEPGVSFTTHVTQKGIAWMVEKLGKEAA